jgi:hypothetical protein
MIDALDECPNRVQHIDFLNDLLSSSESSATVKILITSRDESDIRQRTEFPLWKRIDVTGEQDKNTADIERYVADKIDKIGQAMPQLRDHLGLTDRIRDRLLQSADGMFLYVRVMFDLIEPLKDSSVEDIEQALALLPSGIEGIKSMYIAYFRELAQRAVDYHRHQSHHDFSDSLTLRALWWLVGAKRPLRLEEVSMAIILSSSDDKVEQKKMLANSREVVSRLLGALVDIRRPRADWVIGPPDGTSTTSGLVVTLVHASVKEFLTSTGWSSGFVKGEPAATFLISNQMANAWIATRCLSYLTLDGIFAEYMLHYTEADYYSAFPLLQYSAEHWAEHIIDSQSTGAKNLELRLALAKFVSCALSRILTSVLCMSIGLPKICDVWGKRDKRTRALVDVGLCLHNTLGNVRVLVPQVPDIMAALALTAANLPESSSPPPYAPYDIRRKTPEFTKLIGEFLDDERLAVMDLFVSLYDTRDRSKLQTSAPRTVQLALLEVVRRFPLVRSSVQCTQILVDTSHKFRDAAIALSSIEAQRLVSFSGADATNIVAAFSVTIRAIDMLATLPCLPYVPVSTFEPDELFRTGFSNPFVARHVLADILRTPRTGSVRSSKRLRWRIDLYEFLAKRTNAPLGIIAMCTTSVVFTAMIAFGGWVLTFIITTVILYTLAQRRPLYSFQARYTFSHYRLRAGGPIRITIAKFMAGRILKRLLSDGFSKTLTWLGGAVAFTVGVGMIHAVNSPSFRRILLFRLLVALSVIIGISTPLRLTANVVLCVIWWLELDIALPACLVICSLIIAPDILNVLSKMSLLASIELLWLADTLYTFYILAVDPTGIRETLAKVELVRHSRLALGLVKIIPGQLVLVHLQETLRKLMEQG